MKHIYTAIALFATAVIALTGCSPRPQWHTCTGSVWNTLYNIDYLSDKQLDDSIQATLRAVELSVSAFNPNSTVTQVNQSAEPVKVDSMFMEVFNASQRISRQSGGLFDPTIAPLVNLWGFGYSPNGESIPSADEIAEALRSVGIGECRLSNDTIYKKAPDTQFNFSAIAKGYGCDAVAAMLSRNGCDNYKVEIGGEIALNGHNTRGTEWRIMIDAPVPCDTAIYHESLGIVVMSHGGIATSGSYRNYRDTPQGRRSHTIDPSTGSPIEVTHHSNRHHVSATVIAPTAMDADGLATACMAMLPDSAINMIERIPGAEAMLVFPGQTGGWDTTRTTGFPQHIQ